MSALLQIWIGLMGWLIMVLGVTTIVLLLGGFLLLAAAEFTLVSLTGDGVGIHHRRWLERRKEAREEQKALHEARVRQCADELQKRLTVEERALLRAPERPFTQQERKEALSLLTTRLREE